MRVTFARLVLLFCFLPLSGIGQLPLPIQLVGQSPGPSETIFDIWGWRDGNGTEYAIMGSANHVQIYDLSNPSSPSLIADVDTIRGFDLKTRGDYLYTCMGNASKDGFILNISDPTNPVVVGRLPGTHNFWIDDRGYLYSAYPGLRIYDLNPNPTAPQLIYQDTLADGHDCAVLGDTLYFFEGYTGKASIWDVSNPASPVALGALYSPNISYNHSGWPTRTRSHLLVCDELATHPQADITVWNITDPQNPFLTDSYADPRGTVHNVYVIGDYVFCSYYMQGFRIFDVSNPSQLELIGEYQTFPDSSREGYNGDFGVYPFLPSKNVLVSDMTYGLFVFNTGTALSEDQPQPLTAALEGVFPNPVEAGSEIRFAALQATHLRLSLFDLQGRELIRHEDDYQPGPQEIRWEAFMDGKSLPEGWYLLQLSGEGHSASIRVKL